MTNAVSGGRDVQPRGSLVRTITTKNPQNEHTVLMLVFAVQPKQSFLRTVLSDSRALLCSTVRTATTDFGGPPDSAMGSVPHHARLVGIKGM